ncbi:MAG: hypothetical protein F6K47_03010 [Symploca sp. SIO2E6]|nr:hypothetical protein [Symploca sp. SIO2E6]
MQLTYQSANYQLTSVIRGVPSMRTCTKFRGVDIKAWRELFAEVNNYPSRTPQVNHQPQAARQLKYRSADIQQWRELFRMK